MKTQATGVKEVVVLLYTQDSALSSVLEPLLKPTLRQVFRLMRVTSKSVLIEALQAKTETILLFDLSSSHENSLFELERIHSDYPEVACVALVEKEDAVFEQHLWDIGIVDAWLKPELQTMQILARMRHVQDKARLMRELREERRSMANMVNAIHSGKVDVIASPSGKIRLLDQRLSEENERLVGQIKADTKALDELAFCDPLTQLPNRRQFERTLDSEMARAKRHKRILAVLFIDLDKFKTINDMFGHSIGDALLIEVAARLRATVRTEDCVGRIAGDEFAVIATELKHSYEAGTIAGKLLNKINEVFRISGKEVHMSASIGIAYFPQAGEDFATLCKHADLAMYNAKQGGRNRYEYFTSKLEGVYSKRIKIENSMRFAIERNELHLLYQPQVDLLTGNAVGVEALIRWHHPEIGIISPDDFIPIAEETGLIVQIGEWVFREACKHYAEWMLAGCQPRRLAINISPIQLLQKNLPHVVWSSLQQYAIDPSCIEIELTETAVMSYSEESEAVLIRLKELGVSLVIDDFGTGYSSLSHLRSLPISTLKIDRTFVRDVTTDPSARTIVKTVLALANSLGLATVAEGIETTPQMKFLMDQGCLCGQGYLLSHPMDFEKTSAYLEKNRGQGAMDVVVPEQRAELGVGRE